VCVDSRFDAGAHGALRAGIFTTLEVISIDESSSTQASSVPGWGGSVVTIFTIVFAARHRAAAGPA
jgi:hypothetical protein